jgi:Circadian oscillating protein COP23
MKFLLRSTVCSLFLVLFGIIANEAHPAKAEDARAEGRFYCGSDGSTPVTIGDNGNRKVILIVWERAIGSWNPARRCEQVSRKFQENQNNGNLVEIVPGTANGQTVLCASRDPVSSTIKDCPDSQILMTLRGEDDVNSLIAHLFRVSIGRQPDPVRHSHVLRMNGSVYNWNVNKMFGIGRSPRP